MKKILIDGIENIINMGFDVDFEVVEIFDDNEITILNDGREETYLVFENFEEASDFAKNKLKNDYDICPQEFLMGLNDWVLTDNIDAERVREWWGEVFYDACWNEGIEYLIGDQTLELIESGDISEDEVRENEFEIRMDDIKGCEADEFIQQFGMEEFLKMAIKEEWFNIYGIIDDIITHDGSANILACYDGEEQQSKINDVVAYRIN